MGYMTEERRLIQETARAFAMKEVLPLANKLDPEKAAFEVERGLRVLMVTLLEKVCSRARN